MTTSTKRTRSTAPVGQFSDAKRARMLCAVQRDTPSKAGLFRRIYAGKASPRDVIKAQCLHCCWLEEAAIRECTATECPLWDFRPYQRERAT